MTNVEALHNIFTRFDTIEFAVVEGVRFKYGVKETLLFSFGKKDSNIALLIVTDVVIAVKLYQLNSVSATEKKVEWLLNKYRLMIKSIVKVYDYNSKTMCIQSFDENYLLSYSFLLLKTQKEDTVCVQFGTHAGDINYTEFLEDFNEIGLMVTQEDPKFRISILGENPIAYVRRMKLNSIGI